MVTNWRFSLIYSFFSVRLGHRIREFGILCAEPRWRLHLRKGPQREWRRAKRPDASTIIPGNAAGERIASTCIRCDWAAPIVYAMPLLCRTWWISGWMLRLRSTRPAAPLRRFALKVESGLPPRMCAPPCEKGHDGAAWRQPMGGAIHSESARRCAEGDPDTRRMVCTGILIFRVRRRRTALNVLYVSELGRSG